MHPMIPMKFARFVIVASLALVGAAPASADPARFWISASQNPLSAPEVPSINVPVGRQQTLYIWAQPATDGGGFRILQDFSLDIVTQTAALTPEPQPFIDFVDGTFKIYNDAVVSGKSRFQFVADSLRTADQGGPLLSDKSAAQVMSGQPDAIKGLQGLSIDTSNVVGIGDTHDRVMIGSTPAWRVGEFGIKVLQGSGTNTLFLQIGFSGMLSQGTGDTNVLLGNNASPIYDAAVLNQRQSTLAGDAFDLQVNAVSFLSGDYNGDGTIGPGDYTFWRSTFGQSVTAGQGADGNGNGIVDAGDYIFWRKKMASGAGTSALSMADSNIIVPEPGTASLAAILGLVAYVSILRLDRLRRSLKVV
jgi:hypothetical protein